MVLVLQQNLDVVFSVGVYVPLVSTFVFVWLDDSPPPNASTGRWMADFGSQFKTLCHREFLLAKRWFLSVPPLVQCLTIAIATGLVYWQQPRQEAFIKDKLGLVCAD